MKRLLFTLLLLLPYALYAQVLRGIVVKVSDGDTFTLETSRNKRYKIRLYGIDCPELGQRYGREAALFLNNALREEQVEVRVKYKDRYKRHVSVVYVQKRNINEALLEAGLAWHYTQYDRNKKWSRLEAAARSQRKGLWNQSAPESPWSYRKNVNSRKKVALLLSGNDLWWTLVGALYPSPQPKTT